jgi:hypothetical protein
MLGHEQRQKNLAGTIHLSGFADFTMPSKPNMSRIRNMATQYYRVLFILATLFRDLLGNWREPENMGC